MNNLKKLREEHHYSQEKLAKKLGVARSTISMWETSKSQPDNDSLIRLAELFGSSVDYLLNREESPNGRPGPNWVPVLGEIKAGIPSDACENILDWEELTPEAAASGAYMALRVSGISMEPRFHEGDVVIVHCQSDLESGDIGIVFVNGNAATMKKVMKRPDGIMLVALNPNYEPDYYPHFFSNDEIATLPVRIYGRVVELRAKF